MSFVTVNKSKESQTEIETEDSEIQTTREGNESAQEVAIFLVDEILRKPAEKSSLEELAVSATEQGYLTVLKGFYFKDKPSFKKLLKTVSLLEIAIQNKHWVIAKWLVDTFGLDNRGLEACILKEPHFAPYCYDSLGNQFPVDPAKLLSSVLFKYSPDWNLAEWLVREFGKKCAIKPRHLIKAVEENELSFLIIYHKMVGGQCDLYHLTLVKLIFEFGRPLCLSWILENVDPKDWRKTIYLCTDRRDEDTDFKMTLKAQMIVGLLLKPDKRGGRNFLKTPQGLYAIKIAFEYGTYQQIQLLFTHYGADLFDLSEEGFYPLDHVAIKSYRSGCECQNEYYECPCALLFWKGLAKRFPDQFELHGKRELLVKSAVSEKVVCWLLDTNKDNYSDETVMSRVTKSTERGEVRVLECCMKHYKSTMEAGIQSDFLSSILKDRPNLDSWEGIRWVLSNFPEQCPCTENKDMIREAVMQSEIEVLETCLEVYYKRQPDAFLTCLPAKLSSCWDGYRSYSGMKWLLKRFPMCFPLSQNKDIFEVVLEGERFSTDEALSFLDMCVKLYHGIPNATYPTVLHASVRSGVIEHFKWAFETGGYVDKPGQKTAIVEYSLMETALAKRVEYDMLEFFKDILEDQFSKELTKVMGLGACLTSSVTYSPNSQKVLGFLCEHIHDIAVFELTDAFGHTLQDLMKKKSYESATLIQRRMDELGKQ